MKIRKIITLLLLITIVISSAIPVYAEKEKCLPDIIKGDLYNDGKITSSDALETLRYVVDWHAPNKFNLDPTSKNYGYDLFNVRRNFVPWLINVDNDFEVTATDALIILQYAVNKIDRFENYFLPYTDGDLYVCDTAPEDFVAVKWWEN